jgi:hypothetical protein
MKILHRQQTMLNTKEAELEYETATVFFAIGRRRQYEEMIHAALRITKELYLLFHL